MKFICDMSTVQTYLEMRREVNFGNSIAEILRKSRREERKLMCWMWEREKGISVMILPKKKKIELNCWNWRIKKRKKKKRKLNCGKSNAMATNYFTIYFTNCCYDQFLTSSHQGPPITSFFYLPIIIHHINSLWKFL